MGFFFFYIKSEEGYLFVSIYKSKHIDREREEGREKEDIKEEN